MEEEKVNRWNHTFWPFFGVGSNYSAVLGKRYIFKDRAGFTLIELLIVIAVIAVLAGALVTLINPATQLRRARDTQRKSDLSRIQSAIEIYRADLGVYPLGIPGCGLSLTGGAPPATYMAQVPCDPLSPPPTVYLYSTNAPTLSTYCLRACLENLTDSGRDEIKFGLDNPPNGVTGCSFSAAQVCNSVTRRSYTVQNP